jgi:predicted small lipoprotein YifL
MPSSGTKIARRGAALLLALSLTLAGCGHKGPVRPLELKLPVAPAELTVVQKGARFLLAWTLPSSNQNDTPLTDLQGFHIYRMRYDPAKDCPECRDTSILLQTLDLDYLQGAFRSGERLFLWDSGLEPGFGYQYRVVPYNRAGREGLGALLRRPFHNPPPPPQSLSATGLDRLVRLTWESVPVKDDGVEFLGYNLYRGKAGEPLQPTPLTRATLTETSYDDFGLENGTSYLYGVRTVVRILGQMIESSLSQTVEATPGASL